MKPTEFVLDRMMGNELGGNNYAGRGEYSGVLGVAEHK